MEFSKLFWSAFATGMGLAHGIIFGLMVIVAFALILVGIFNATNRRPPLQ